MRRETKERIEYHGLTLFAPGFVIATLTSVVNAAHHRPSLEQFCNGFLVVFLCGIFASVCLKVWNRL